MAGDTESVYERVKPMTTAVQTDIPVLAIRASLACFDSYCTARLPANLTQAQHDYVSARTFERGDREGCFHANWLGS